MAFGWWALIYGLLGAIYLVYSVDEDTDEFYGELKPAQRYLFFAGSVILWPPLLLRRLLRRKNRREEEEL